MMSIKYICINVHMLLGVERQAEVLGSPSNKAPLQDYIIGLDRSHGNA